jgi:hypothetical protein
MIQKTINRIIILLVAIYGLICNFNIDGTCSKSIAWDAFGYYAYLPSTFLSGDIGNKNLEKIDVINKQYKLSETLYQFNTLPNGNHPIRYSSGVALVSLPFFACGHINAKLAGYPTDGYSLPYQLWFNVSNLFWLIVGIIAFNKLLQQYFNLSTTNIVLALIFIGTNFIHNTIKSFGNTHLFEFSFYSLYVLQLSNYFANRSNKKSILIGLTAGIITVIRPINILCLILFAFWEMNPFRKEELLKRLNLIKANLSSFNLFLLGFLIAVLPQLIYWQLTTGFFLYQGYDNNGEGLDIFNPHTLNFLFSFRKGWFLYTPIMVFSFVGMYIMLKKKIAISNTLITFSIINIFLLSTWTCWWYASCYSQRTVIDTYPILSISLGYFVEDVINSSKGKKIILSLIASLLIIINLFKMWQFDKGILNMDSETKPHFINNYFSTTKQNDDSLLLIPRNSNYEFTLNNPQNYISKQLYFNNFDNVDESFPDNLVFEEKENRYIIKSEQEFTKGNHIPFMEITEKTHAYIKVSFDVLFTKKYTENKFVFVELFEHKAKGYAYHAREIGIVSHQDSLTNKWYKQEFYLQTPEVRNTADIFTCYFWNYGHNEIKIDNFKIESYEPIFDPK